MLYLINMTKYAIIYTFNGQAKWDLVKAGSVTEARRKLLDKYPSYNIRILDISTLWFIVKKPNTKGDKKMVGDFEKLLNKGDKLSMNVLGKTYEVTVKDTDISDYERKYLIAFSDMPGDSKWINNTIVRQFRYTNWIINTKKEYV